MTSLVWLQFAMSFGIGGYISHNLTKAYYKRKIRKMNLEKNLSSFASKT